MAWKKWFICLIMPTQKPILTFAADKELLERINDFRFDNRIETKSEAIRTLVEKGLKEYEKKTKKWFNLEGICSEPRPRFS